MQATLRAFPEAKMLSLTAKPQAQTPAPDDLAVAASLGEEAEEGD